MAPPLRLWHLLWQPYVAQELRLLSCNNYLVAHLVAHLLAICKVVEFLATCASYQTHFRYTFGYSNATSLVNIEALELIVVCIEDWVEAYKHAFARRRDRAKFHLSRCLPRFINGLVLIRLARLTR